MISPFRAMVLGYRYHELYQEKESLRRDLFRANAEIYKLIKLSEQRLRACRSLEQQKIKLQLQVEALQENNRTFGWPEE